MYQTCIREDAMRRIGGLTAIPRDIVNLIIADLQYWNILQQFVKICKPIVDAIGNLESRTASLAECLLELIRCAKAMSELSLDEGEDASLWNHAKATFNSEFHRMDTDLHALALFLHPLCRKLAVSQRASGRNFEVFCKIALEVARKWGWDEKRAFRLLDDMQLYYQMKDPFIGGKASAKDWWESLEINVNKHPLMIMGLRFALIVPHSAEVERLFSDLGGVQGTRRSRLTVDRFEALAKLRANYKKHNYHHLNALGKPTQRQHGHSHTRKEGGIDIPLVEDLEQSFSLAPPITSTTNDDASNTNLDAMFEELGQLPSEEPIDPALRMGEQITAGQRYDFSKLESIQKGVIPAGEVVDLSFAEETVPGGWDAEALLRAKGISS